jgi:hypothetical protein
MEGVIRRPMTIQIQLDVVRIGRGKNRRSVVDEKGDTDVGY